MTTRTPEERILSRFKGVLDDGTPWRHPNFPITFIEARGRCVHVRLSGRPEWARLFEDLVCDGGPCTEFRLDGRDLYARLKTEAQLAADDSAHEFDEQNGELLTFDIPQCILEAEETEAQPRKPKKDRKRGPLYTALADHIEASGEDTFYRRDLLADVRKALEDDGREVRPDSLARTLDTQIVGALVEVVPDSDGEQLRLKDE